MPSTDNRTRTLMHRWFGYEADKGAEALLMAQGFTLDREWCWRKPTPAHTCTEIQRMCLKYLTEEWDHGYLG